MPGKIDRDTIVLSVVFHRRCRNNTTVTDD